MTSIEDRISLKCSIQRALLDEVPDNLYALTCDIDENKVIQLVAYFDGPVTQEDWDTIWTVGGEVIADFPEGYTINEQCFDVTQSGAQGLDFWAFRRKRKPNPANV